MVDMGGAVTPSPPGPLPPQAVLSNTNFTNADLSNCDLSHTHLANTNLSDANLRGSTLLHADLMGADLRSASLTVANLSHQDLRCGLCSRMTVGGLGGVVKQWWYAHPRCPGPVPRFPHQQAASVVMESTLQTSRSQGKSGFPALTGEDATGCNCAQWVMYSVFRSHSQNCISLPTLTSTSPISPRPPQCSFSEQIFPQQKTDFQCKNPCAMHPLTDFFAS